MLLRIFVVVVYWVVCFGFNTVVLVNSIALFVYFNFKFYLKLLLSTLLCLLFGVYCLVVNLWASVC